MDIRVLRYFLAVAQEESISAAANSLHVTQPTLSRQLMDLEAALGSTLFIRSNRKISLTEHGMRLRKRAQEIVTLFDKTTAEFNTPEEIVSGDIYIGAGETHTISVLARAAKALQNDNPGISYHMFSGNADDVAERLDKGLLDFGVFIGSVNFRKYDFIGLPGLDIWGLLMRKDSPLALQSSIKSQDLCSLPLIISNQSLVSNQISGWGQHDLAKLNIVATYNLVYNASLLVQEGLGYALCLDKLVNNSELCFRPLQPQLNTSLSLAWKKQQIFSKAANLFLKKLQETISNNYSPNPE